MSKAVPQPTTDPKKRNKPSLAPTSTTTSSTQTPATPKKTVAEQSQNAPPSSSGSSEAAVKRALYKQRKRKILQKIDNELNNALNGAKYISDSSDDDDGSAREMMAPFGLIPVSDDENEVGNGNGSRVTNGHAPGSKDKTGEKEDKDDESAFWLGEKRYSLPFPCKLAASLDVKHLLSRIRSLTLDETSPDLLSSKVFSEDEIKHLQSLLPEEDSPKDALQYVLSEGSSLGPMGSFLEDLGKGKFDHARQLEIKQNRHKERGEVLLFQSNYTDKMIKTILDYKTKTGSTDMYCYLLLDQQFCSPNAKNQRRHESDSDTSSVSSTSSEDSSFSEAETDDFFSMPEATSISPLSEDHFASITLPSPVPAYKPPFSSSSSSSSSFSKPKPAPVVHEAEPEVPKAPRQEITLPPRPIVIAPQVPSTTTVTSPAPATPAPTANASVVASDKDLNSTPRSKKRPRRNTPPAEDPKARKKMKLDGSPPKESSSTNGDEEATGGEYADPELETDPSVEPAPPVWAFLSSIRDIFLLCHREANTPYIVSEIEKNEEKNKFVMPNFTAQQFVLMALNFLAEPPSLSSSPNGELRDNYNLLEALNRPPRGTDDEPMMINPHTNTSNPDSADHSSVSSPSQSQSLSSSSSSHIDIVQNIALHQALQHQPPTPSSAISPFVQYDKEKDLWTWIGKVEEEQTKDQLDTLELLFYYCASRGYTQDDNTRIKFSMMKHQKCTPTVPATSPENVERFRAQEAFRYKEQPYVPFYYDFNNTLTMIAPLKRNTIGISSQKAREHFLLKADRPPHVSLLSLVRDAAAKLPGGVGTRPDVAILLRDSQFVVQEVPDNKLNAVVSGALDRLHADEDPCVRYDSDQKLWIYLHRRRTPASFAPQTVRPKRRAAPRKPQPPAPQ